MKISKKLSNIISFILCSAVLFTSISLNKINAATTVTTEDLSKEILNSWDMITTPSLSEYAYENYGSGAQTYLKNDYLGQFLVKPSSSVSGCNYLMAPHWGGTPYAFLDKTPLKKLSVNAWMGTDAAEGVDGIEDDYLFLGMIKKSSGEVSNGTAKYTGVILVTASHNYNGVPKKTYDYKSPNGSNYAWETSSDWSIEGKTGIIPGIYCFYDVPFEINYIYNPIVKFGDIDDYHDEEHQDEDDIHYYYDGFQEFCLTNNKFKEYSLSVNGNTLTYSVAPVDSNGNIGTPVSHTCNIPVDLTDASMALGSFSKDRGCFMKISTIEEKYNPQTTHAKINVRYENTDGSFTNYESVVDRNFNVGEMVNWQRAADDTYQAAAISWSAEYDREEYVTVYRKRYNVVLNKGTGINSVSGAGSYRVGQSVTIDAGVTNGYHWVNWTGTYGLSEKRFSFTMPSYNVTETANGAINQYTVTYIDRDADTGAELGRTTRTVNHGTNVNGADIGSPTNDNDPYPQYHYVSSTSANGITGDVTVYRNFKFVYTSVAGTVSWKDNSNAFGTRPDSVTVTLYQNGSPYKSQSGLTDSVSNTFSFTNLPKYDTAGNAYVYTAGQSKALSKTAPEDKYVTTQPGTFDFVNELENTADDGRNPTPDPDTPAGGLVLKGSVWWVDLSNKLKLRPSTVTINLYRAKTEAELNDIRSRIQNGEEVLPYDSFVIDKPYYSDIYSFTWLQKYWYDDNDVPQKYLYTTAETFTAKYINTNTGELIDAYTIYEDTPNTFDFTNKLSIEKITGIPVRETTNTITVRTNLDEKVSIDLVRVDEAYDDNLDPVYGDPNPDEVRNLFPNNVGETVIKIPSGKYEIVNSSRYLIEDAYVSISGVTVEEENGKWYIIIPPSDEDIISVVDLVLVKDPDRTEGYETTERINNYFALEANFYNVGLFALRSISNKAVSAETYTVSFDTDMEDIITDGEFIVPDFTGYLGENEVFMGWGYNGELVFSGDIITITEDILLVPVFDTAEDVVSDTEYFEDFTETIATD